MFFDDRPKIERALERMVALPRFCVRGELRMLVITALRTHLNRIDAAPDPLLFKVEGWSDDGRSLIEMLATAGNLTVAHAAYDAAVARTPSARITLRKGVWVVRSTEKDAERREVDG